MNLTQLSAEHLPIGAGTVDMIFTDPPYPKDYLPCYEWLAQEAMRVLRPGGFVLAMCGGMYLNQIFRMFDEAGLTYFWEFHHSGYGQGSYIRARDVIAKSKSILAYSKGAGVTCVNGVQSIFEARGKMKLYHHWGQDVGSARYYIDHFTAPGDLVLDPFIGGGTTAVACELIGRRWIGGDIDRDALATTRYRLKGEMAPAVQSAMFLPAPERVVLV